MTAASDMSFNSWAEWKDSVDRTILSFTLAGVPVKTMIVNLDEFKEWSRGQGVKADAKARARYASLLASTI